MHRVADVFSKKIRSKVMAAIHSKGNKATELKLASILRAHGIECLPLADYHARELPSARVDLQLEPLNQILGLCAVGGP